MKKINALLFWAWLIAGIPGAILGQSWDEFRNKEAVVINGGYIPAFQTVPVSQIFLYSFSKADQQWRQITFQIDQLDGDEGYFAADYNDVIDGVDEIVFMAGDAGDTARAYQWIDDSDSRRYARYQIQVANPDDSQNFKYVYVYRSTTLVPDPNLPVYMQYVPSAGTATDTIHAAGYTEGHSPRDGSGKGGGVSNTWKIPISAGGNGLDFLDRQKARVNGNYYTIYPFQMAEPDLIDKGIKYKTGPVRTIRDIVYEAEFQGVAITVGTFKTRFYPYHVVGLGTNKTLTSEYGISLVRQSFDLNVNADGMLFNNPNNVDVVIDGDGGVSSKVIYPLPDLNWYLCSGNAGSFVMINEFTPPSGAAYTLYYYDNENANGKTADNTSDTGDRKSYGDTGILFTGSKIEGGFSLPYTAYFLPKNQPRATGEVIANHYRHPLTARYSSHGYSPAVEIALSLPDTSAPAKSRLLIPVRIGDVKGEAITAVQFSVQYNPQVLSLLEVVSANSLTQDWVEPQVALSGDTMTIALSGATPLSGAGVLVNLSFSVIGDEGSSCDVQFTEGTFNDGYPLASLADGHFLTTASQVVTVALPDTTAEVNTSLVIPVQVGDVTGLNIASCVLEVSFDETVVAATAFSTEGMLTSGWSDFSFQTKNGWLKLTMSGIEPLSGAGGLVGLSFDVIGGAGLRSDLVFDVVQFNYGYPLATNQNGSVTVTEPPEPVIHVSIPDSTKPSMSALHTPATVSPVTGFGVKSYVMSMRYDATVLQFKGVDIAGSLTEIWGMPAIYTFSGGFTVNASGSAPLTGEGPLIYLTFDVIGADGTSSDISFASMQFNGGAIDRTTDNGTITVLGVVPVELTSFNAFLADGAVHLEWRTATESNNYGFFVQKKKETAGEFQRIGFVAGNGTTASPHAYGFVDQSVGAGAWTYRLEQQDFNGQVSYSPEVMVAVTAPERFALHQNYPNPFNAVTTIRYEVPAGDHAVRLIVYDVLGHAVRTLVNSEHLSAGVYQVVWDGADESHRHVPSGVYFCQLKTGFEILVRKMVIIE